MLFKSVYRNFEIMTILVAAATPLATFGSGGPMPSAPDTRSQLLENRYLEPEILRANAIEALMKNKINETITSRGIAENLFQSTVSVKVVKQKPKDKKADSKKVQPDNNPPNFLDAMRDFRTDTLVDQLYGAGDKGRAPAASESGPNNDNFVVSSASAYVGLHAKLAKDAVDAIEANIKSQLASIVDSGALSLKVENVPLVDDQTKFIDNVAKLQGLAICALLGVAIIVALLLWKFLTGKGSRNQLKLDMNQKQKRELEGGRPQDNANDPNTENTASRKPSGDEDRDLEPQIEALKKKVAVFAERNPQGFSRQIENWVNMGEPEYKVALAFESVSDEGRLPPKINVDGDMLRALKSAKETILRMEQTEIVANLEWIYWDLVASACFGERGSESPLKFLEQFDDGTIAMILLGEEPGLQNLILSSIESRRASKILAKLKPEIRQNLLNQLTSDEIATVEINEATKTHLQQKAEQVLARGPQKSDDSGTGQALLAILEAMDFDTQFKIAQNLVSMTHEKRVPYMKRYFNVAFMPLFCDEYLSGIFTDRPAEWIVAVTSVYEGLLERVIAFLPPIQQRMLEGVTNTMSKKNTFDLIEKLNSELSSKVNSGEIALESVYGDGWEGQGETGETDEQLAA